MQQRVFLISPALLDRNLKICTLSGAVSYLDCLLNSAFRYSAFLNAVQGEDRASNKTEMTRCATDDWTKSFLSVEING